MKRITFLLCAALLLTGCGAPPSHSETSETESGTTVTEFSETAVDAKDPDGVNIVYAAETTDYWHIT